METPDFQGVIGDDWRDSTPWWPEVPSPPPGAPNVVLVVLDDVGFAQLGCYGSDIDTPTIDGLADAGVRLANFHTTALCSPTRACLLTGRNHHRNGLGRVADLAMGFPGYNGEVPRENGFLSEILRQQGYATYAVGKWHLTPDDETSMAAPRHSWPLARGFDRWYGFHGGETHQFVPTLYHDNHSIQPPRSIEEGYHLSADLADQAIAQLADLRAVDVDRRSSSTSAPAPAIRPTTPRPSGSSATGAGSTRVGTAGGRRSSPASSESGCCRRDRAGPPTLVGPGLGRPAARRAAGGGPVHGVLRRLPVLHRRPTGPGARLPRPDRRP